MNTQRRRFVKSTIGAGMLAPALLSSCIGKAPKPHWRMKLSTSSVQYRPENLAEAVRRISQLGFEAIDVWSHFDWGGPLCEHLEEGFAMGTEGFAALLSENNLKLGAATCYRVPSDKFAVQLGEMGGCVVVRGSTNDYGKGADLSYRELKVSMRKFIESIRAEADVLGEHKCTLAIENHGGGALLNVSDSFKLFREFNDMSNVGIGLAPYHIQRTPESVPEVIRVCGDQLRFFYAWQLQGGGRQLPGIGPVDVGPWLEALDEVDYQGYVNPFMHAEVTPDELDGYLRKSRSHLLSKHSEMFFGR